MTEAHPRKQPIGDILPCMIDLRCGQSAASPRRGTRTGIVGRRRAVLGKGSASIGERLPINIDEMAGSAHLASEFLKALAHESRLLILCLLTEGEKSVGELEELLSQPQSTVSQQLARLRLDGLVSTRREGKTICYSLADEKVRVVLEALCEAFCGTRNAGRH